MNSIYHLVFLGALLTGVGCQHGQTNYSRLNLPQARAELSPATVPTDIEAQVYFDAAWDASPDRKNYRTPRNGIEVRATLMRALQALETHELAEAHSHFRSILATDLLTDEGRMSMYWYAGQAASESGDHVGFRDAMQGYLLTASLLDELTQEQRDRHQHARAALVAHHIAAGQEVGRTPDTAVVVVDASEPTRIIKALSCGPQGSERFHVIAQEDIDADQYGALVKHQVSCTGGGSLSFWFNIK